MVKKRVIIRRFLFLKGKMNDISKNSKKTENWRHNLDIIVLVYSLVSISKPGPDTLVFKHFFFYKLNLHYILGLSFSTDRISGWISTVVFDGLIETEFFLEIRALCA